MCSLGADPYFTIECEGEKVRSHTVNNNLNPEWDASATFYRKNPHSDILIEVKISLYIIVALSGQQTLVELHASRTNEDVRMYIEEYLF